MSNPNSAPITALGLPEMPRHELPPEIDAYFGKCEEKLGFVPNVLRAHSFDGEVLRIFIESYNRLMFADSELSRLDREMIAVVVSAQNRCYYCLVSHGQAVRELSGKPELGEQLVMNYRIAALEPRQRAMLDFCVKLTVEPEVVDEADRERLRAAGFSNRAIWDIVSTAAFYAMSNRLSIGTEMQPNSEYHARSR